MVVFLHIPKTAGTTLRAIIEKNYKPEEIFSVDGKDPTKSVADFHGLPAEEKAGFSLFQGHINFSVIDKLPYDNMKCMTFLRDPVERVLSYYYYIVSDSLSRPQAEVAKKTSFKEYLLSGDDPQLSNFQTKMVAGEGSSWYEECDKNLLSKAKDNLSNYFDFVGIAESFDESVLCMSKTFGWKTPYYKRINVTKNRTARKNIDGEIIEIISEMNSYDRELYVYAKEILHNNFSKRLNSFEIKKFKLLNKLLS